MSENIKLLSEMYCTATKERMEQLKQLPIITRENVLEELSMAGIPFTWETVTDFALDETSRILEIRLYLPGNILYGRTSYEINNSEIAHRKAICEALNCLVYPKSKTEQTPQPIQQEVPVQTPVQPQTNITQPLSNDEIMNMVQQQSAATKEPITTAEQLQNDERTEIPYDEVQLNDSELDKLLSGNNNSQPSPAPATPSQPTSPMAFTQEQIKGMIEFKQKFNITTDEMLGTYINAWNNKLSKKEDLNGENINAFLQWTQMLGKAPY